jgi:hypothetical protein
MSDSDESVSSDYVNNTNKFDNGMKFNSDINNNNIKKSTFAAAADSADYISTTYVSKKTQDPIQFDDNNDNDIDNDDDDYLKNSIQNSDSTS